MTVDCNAWCGPWPRRPGAPSSLTEVWARLEAAGVERALVSSLGSVWCANPHAPNERLIDECAALPAVLPVPTIDPTVQTWREHLAQLARSADVRMVRLLPSYSPYDLSHPQVDDLLVELRHVGLSALVQCRLEDPRQHHPLAQVPDLPAAQVVELAQRHPGQTIVIGGARFSELEALARDVLRLNLLYADTSQCDGLDAIRLLCDSGLGARLLYGSHVPFFAVSSGLRRVLDDLDETQAAQVLGGNARRALSLN